MRAQPGRKWRLADLFEQMCDLWSQWFRPLRREPERRRRPGLAGPEDLEVRVVPAAPDLAGYDLRPNGYPNYFFHFQESPLAWGDVVHLNFPIANLGGAAA